MILFGFWSEVVRLIDQIPQGQSASALVELYILDVDEAVD